MSTLSHQEIYKDSRRAAVELPLGEALGALGAGATFPSWKIHAKPTAHC